jgi:hypothetical protein
MPSASRIRRARRLTLERLEGRAVLAATPLPTVSIADASITEGNSGTKTLSFAVTLSTAATATTTVRYSTADGTATTGNADYTAKSGTVTFARGASQATVSVAIKGDAAVEADETLRITLSSPNRCTLGRATATGTIVNDDVPPPPPTTGSWTILVYMTGEDLNGYARTDINEMEKALGGMPAGVRFVVSWDQPKVGVATAYATGGGTQPAWRTYGRSVLKADASTSTIASTFDLSFGERNTGDPATLVDFVKWGTARAPADHYVLQMWGHGGGLDGSQFDSESGGDALTIPEMAAALGSAGMPAFDVVSYDNCLMAMAEVGAALAPKVGGVFVASEEVVDGTGQDYTTCFAALKTNPSQVTATQLAAGMVSSYGTQYVDGSNTADTFSATVAAGYANLTAALRTFVTATSTLGTADRTAVRTAATGSVAYDEPSFKDLGTFMTRVAASTSLPTALKTAATGVKAALASVVSAKTADQRSSGGLSIYLPTSSTDAYLSTYTTDAAAFCAATGWDAFAKWLATGTRSAATATGLAGTKAHGGRAALDAAFAALATADASAPTPRRTAVRARG